MRTFCQKLRTRSQVLQAFLYTNKPISNLTTTTVLRCLKLRTSMAEQINNMTQLAFKQRSLGFWRVKFVPPLLLHLIHHMFQTDYLFLVLMNLGLDAFLSIFSLFLRVFSSSFGSCTTITILDHFHVQCNARRWTD